jgi:peptidoglycan/xylan/chitin deacetylase (PgdA/CDA1 family)/LysM repeat protein
MRSATRSRFAPLALLILVAACAAPSVTSTPLATSSPSASGSPSPSASATSTATATATVVPSAAVTTYVVQGGDTLFGIARRFGTTPANLQTWNAARYPSLVSDPGTLVAGWELIVAQQPGVTPQPTAQPTPPATPRPTVPPPVGDLPCRAGNRAGGGMATYARIPNAGNEVALTFDMGGRLDPALDIMAFLVANKVCATIFATGAMSSTPIGQQVLGIIRAHPGQFEIGNHTQAHCDLVRGGGGSPTTAPCVTGGPPSASFIRSQLTDAEAILRAGTGQDPRPYWRPPYGSINPAVLAAAASVGYTKTFLWDVDSIDWKPESQGGPTAQQIASKVITNAQGGSTVLFHLGGYNTLEAVKVIVPALRQRGLVISSLSDLLDGS